MIENLTERKKNTPKNSVKIQPLWLSGLERQFQIQVEAHSKTQVRIQLGDDYKVIIMPTL